MRDRLGAPITFAPNLGGYQYESGDFNLPGIWFSEAEVYSLLLMHSLLDQLQPGFVREQLAPFEGKLRALLDNPARGAARILDRMHVSAAPQRPVNAQHFQAICDGTLRRKKLRMRYYTRYRGSESDRVVSPDSIIFD
jgi:predicted DNA-binding transcriptional regulator YafY